MNREDILRKAKGILEMSRSGNENEMMAAASMLQVFMAKYGLTLGEIEASASRSSIDEDYIDGKYNESWRRTCYSAAAEMFMCKYYFVPVGTKEVGCRHYFVGEAHNRPVAIEVGKYFEATINRLANEASRAIPRGEHTERNRFIRTFRLEASRRVYSRVLEYVADAKAGRLTDPVDGSNVPALLSLFDASAAAIAAWLSNMNMTFVETTQRDRITHADAAALGRQAGNSISFTTQIHHVNDAPKAIGRT